MALIGYTCSYIPVELLSATGLRPYRLLHGDIYLSKEGEKAVRVDACPLVKSNLSYIIENRNKFAALVGSTGCDMARRMHDVASELTDLPVFVMNTPRTDNPTIYNEETDWLIKQLEHLSDRAFHPELLISEISKWEKIRSYYRSIDRMRAASPSSVSTTEFHRAVAHYYKGKTDTEPQITKQISDKPRVFLLGSSITYEANPILELIEQEMRIVGDFNCGLSRILDIKIHERNLAGLKEAYYNQPPCIFKRPNAKYYDWIRTKIEELECIGIVAWTLDYCDIYEFEMSRIEKSFDLPVLRIRSDFSYQNLNQLRTRIGAFGEMLCSRI
jgi:benzoyl-CoA reductase/2-hydroxyglutaryl-CoA dehydratase subunit BcrC/BadD/HgdB